MKIHFTFTYDSYPKENRLDLFESAKALASGG